MSKFSKESSKISQRWVTVFLGMLGLLNAFSMRVCLSIAITEMTLAPNRTQKETLDETCVANSSYNVTQLTIVKYSITEKYEWSERMQGLILSSFYWGYICSCILGGIICQKFGGKHTLGLAILVTSVFTLLTPYCIYWGGATGLIILRIAMGIGEGTTFPAISHLLANWIPETERSRAGAVAFSGGQIGVIFGMTMSGVILEHSDIGWPIVFYFYGGFGLISYLLIAFFVYDRPSDNPYISDEELSYLKDNIKNTHKNLPPTPWRYILSSPAAWTSILAKFGVAYTILTIISDMPKYMKSVLKFSVQNNGFFSSIPHLSAWMGNMSTCWVADKLIAKGIVTITAVRKIGCTISLLGSGIFLVAASYAGCNSFAVVTLQSIGLALLGSASSGIMVNALDLSPNYASTIMGLGNGIASISGMFAPYIVGVLTPNQTINEWRLVFWIVCAVAVTCNVAFVICGSGKVQEWNNPEFFNKKVVPTNEDKKSDVLVPLNKV